MDPRWIERFEAAGHDLRSVFETASLAADAAVPEGIPDDVTLGLHICRGNFHSSWMCGGSWPRWPSGCSAGCPVPAQAMSIHASRGQARSANNCVNPAWSIAGVPS